MKSRNKKTKFLILLRRFNLLKRKTRPNPYSRIRVSRVVLPYAGYTKDFNATSQHIHNQIRQSL